MTLIGIACILAGVTLLLSAILAIWYVTARALAEALDPSPAELWEAQHEPMWD